MPVIVTPESELGKEMAKWEQHQTAIVGPGQQPGRPYVYQEYPRMVYRAVKRPDGKVVCMEGEPDPGGYAVSAEFERALAAVTARNRLCNRLVEDAAAWGVLQGQGWFKTPQEAVDGFEEEERARGNAAAETEYQAQRMSPQAQAELKQAHEDTMEHVTDVVPTPKRGAGGRFSKASNAEEPEE
jgi:hypothetical protein